MLKLKPSKNMTFVQPVLIILKLLWVLGLVFFVHYFARKNNILWLVKTHVISAFLAYLFLIQGLFLLYLQQFLKNCLKQGKQENRFIKLLLQLHPKGIQTHNLTMWIGITGLLILVSIFSGFHYYDYQWQQLLNFKFIISIITALGLCANFLWRTLFSYRGHLSYLLFEISGICFILGHALFYFFRF